MAEPVFLELRRRLIQGGISPRRVSRLLQELRDHNAELVLEQKRAGSPQPVEDALARLGTEESVARLFLARPELLSWSRRWPWAVYVLTPLLLFPAAFAATIYAMVGLVPILHGADHTRLTPLLEVLRMIRLFDLYVLPVIAASGFALLAKRRGVSSAWAWAAIGFVAFLGALPNIEVSAHQIAVGVNFATRLDFLAKLFLKRWLPTAASAVMLYVVALHVARRMRSSDGSVASLGAHG